jgi:hypothetical protein
MIIGNLQDKQQKLVIDFHQALQKQTGSAMGKVEKNEQHATATGPPSQANTNPTTATGRAT